MDTAQFQITLPVTKLMMMMIVAIRMIVGKTCDYQAIKSTRGADAE